MSLPVTIPGAWTPSTPVPYTPYFGYGSSNQVYSNSLPVENVPDDGDGENQPSRPYIPDSSDSVAFEDFGSVPNDAGGSAADNLITLQPADATHPGGVSTTAQDFAGNKRFLGDVRALSVLSDSYVELPATTLLTVGTLRQNGGQLLHSYGMSNLFCGPLAGNFTLTGQGNNIFGGNGGDLLTSGSFNTGVGHSVLTNATSAVGNTFVGNSSGVGVTTATQNVGIGINSGASLTTGGSNVLIGPNTGTALTTQSNIVEIGNGTLKAPAADDVILGNATSAQCYIGGVAGVAVGGVPQMVTVNPATKQIGSTAVPASGVLSLSAIGASANANGATITGTVLNLEPASVNFGGVVTTTAQSWAGIKTYTDAINLFPSNSLGVGTIQQSGGSLLHTHGVDNTFLGTGAGNFTLTGVNNTAVGSGSMVALTTGSGNCCFGTATGAALTTGQASVYVGNHAGGQCTTPNNNVCVGTYAGWGLTTGAGNVFVGPSAGFSSATTCNNAVELSNGSIGTSITGDIRIGTSASLMCYIAALSPTVAAPTSMVVYDSATRQVGSSTLSDVSAVFTATLDVGSITTMTVRGAATTSVPIRCTRLNNTVTMRVPRYSLTAQTGSALTINLGGAGIASQFRPTYDSWFAISIVDNSNVQRATLFVTAGGLVSIQRDTGTAFHLPSGPLYDINVSWVIGA